MRIQSALIRKVVGAVWVVALAASPRASAVEAFVVTHSPGIAGRIYQSAVAVHNLGGGDLGCELKLLSGPSRLITVTEAEGVWAAEDVVPFLTGSLASLTDGLTVDCTGAFALTSRLWGEAFGEDSGGFDIVTTEGLNQVSPATSLAVLGAANGPTRRTDMWLVNLHPSLGATVLVTARPSGLTRLISVPPRTLVTERGVLGSMGLAGAAGVTLELAMFGGSTGPVAVTAALLDLETLDFAALTPVRLAGSGGGAAVPVERTGDGSVVTHLDLFNPGSTALVAGVTLSLADGTVSTLPVAVPAGAPVTLLDVVHGAFGLLEGLGLVWVDAAGGTVLAQSRVERSEPFGTFHGGTAALPFTVAPVLRGSGWTSDVSLATVAGSRAAGAEVGLAFSPPTSPTPAPPSVRAGAVVPPYGVATAAGPTPVGTAASVTEVVIDGLPEAVAYARHLRAGSTDPSWTPLWRSLFPRPVVTGNAAVCRNVPARLEVFPQWPGVGVDWFLDGRPLRSARGSTLTTHRTGRLHVTANLPGFNDLGRSRPVDLVRDCSP